MPIIHVNIIEGRTDEQKELLIHEITEAVNRAINAPKESVRVLISDVPAQHWGIGGRSAKKLGR